MSVVVFLEKRLVDVSRDNLSMVVATRRKELIILKKFEIVWVG